MSQPKHRAGMRPGRMRAVHRVLAGMTIGAFGAAAVLFTTGVSKATPLDDYVADNAVVICALLDENPTVDGVESVGAALVGKGLPARLAGNVMARSVIGFCPEHLEELQLFIAKWRGMEA